MFRQGKWLVSIIVLVVLVMASIGDVAFAKEKNVSKTLIEILKSNALTKDNAPNNSELTYKVYLPKGYNANSKKTYPVVYLLHGSSGDENSWDDFWGKLDKMIANDVIEPVIAVVPASGNSYWVNSDKFGAYESAVIQDLIPHIDKKYKTKSNRSNRYIAGYSMGGYGALRYAMVYPELFKAATLLSPAIQSGEAPATSGAVERGAFGDPFDEDIWTANNYPTAISEYAKQPLRVPVFIFTGDDDWNHLSEKEDLPRDAYKYNMEVQAVQLYQELHRKNLFNKDFEKWEDVPGSPAELRIIDGGHSLKVWLQGFEEGLIYMLGQDKK